MQPNTCDQLIKDNIGSFILFHRNNNQEQISNILKCLHDRLRPNFLKWASITYSDFPKDTIEFNADISFTDAVLKIQNKALQDELYKGDASIKTVLFIFFKYVLLDNLKQHNRREKKNKTFAQTYHQDTQPRNFDERDDKEEKFAIIEGALSSLNATDKQIIIWRHIDGKKNDEIAQLLKISIPSATNRIYRCMERLKIEIEKIQSTNGYNN